MITWNKNIEKKANGYGHNYMNADSFIVYIKTEDIYVDIVNDVEARLDVTD